MGRVVHDAGEQYLRARAAVARRNAATIGPAQRCHNRTVQQTPVTDSDKRRALRRMKAVAGGLLLFATLVYVLARWQESGGAVWAGYVRASAEAGMVGALADWFAVTALFRHPLGLPI